MSEAGATITADDGGDVIEFFTSLENAIQIREEDVRTVLEEQRTEILDRTINRGVDFEERPFEAYSTKGPYYWTPSPGGTVKQRQAAVKRLHKTTSEVSELRSLYGSGGASGGTISKNRLSIKFDSYGDFKASLGRRVVDLFGPKAPHMLMNLIVRITGATEGALGIYAEPFASRAEGHNNGAGHLPRRRFLDASAADLRRMQDRLEEIVFKRLTRAGK